MNLLYEAFKPVIPLFILIAVCALIVMLFVQTHYKYEESIAKKSFTVLSQYGLFLSIVGILLVTFLPRNNPERIVILEPFSSIRDTWMYAEGYVFFNAIVMNILFFVPFALFLYWVSRSVLLTLSMSILLSVSIEVMQYVLPIGRISNIDDVFLNVTGAVIGIIIGAISYHGASLLLTTNTSRKRFTK